MIEKMRRRVAAMGKAREAAAPGRAPPSDALADLGRRRAAERRRKLEARMADRGDGGGRAGLPAELRGLVERTGWRWAASIAFGIAIAGMSGLFRFRDYDFSVRFARNGFLATVGVIALCYGAIWLLRKALEVRAAGPDGPGAGEGP